MRTTREARRVIVGALLVMAAITFVREVRRGKLPEPRTAVGAFGATMALSALAGPLPDVAAGMALVALVAHVITERGTLGTIADVFEPRRK
jgi:hypothetical protein